MELRKKKLLALHLGSMCYTTLVMLKRSRVRSRRWWVHPLWKRRRTEGAYLTLVKSLRDEDPSFFKKYLRMNPDEFDEIKAMVKHRLKKHPSGRKALSVGHQLAITIRYLASGDSMNSISFAFRIGFSTTHSVIKRVCQTLWDIVGRTVLPNPTQENWKGKADEFLQRWQFPNCIGVVDGKHIQIQAPAKSGTMYYNYKGYFSTVLMAVVDSNYKFIVVDVGGYGSNSDGGLWKASKFGSRFDLEKINIPPPAALPSTDKIVPHVLLGDEAFQLRLNFLRPFPAKHLTESKRIFNYRLSRARRCVENAFGILASRWRIFRRAINLKPNNVDLVVKACIVLHNFLKMKSEESSIYCPKGYADYFDSEGTLINGDWRDELTLTTTAFRDLPSSSVKNYAKSAGAIRDQFMDYFVNSGSVPWQSEAAGINELYE